ncbi:MAG: integrase core domain-containing protein, partial [Alphaproteobacteria bacterium]|nr:integrase core domain-containing protein [Alphaproteobacteria bacterium]
PQQNGRHERMHLTLKQETASPPADSLAEQLVRFRDFQQVFNHQRPHQALGQIPPADVYSPSPRSWDGQLRSPDYHQSCQVRKVRSNGEIKWKGRTAFVSSALKGEPVGLWRIGENNWLVKYGPIILGTIKGENKMHRIMPIKQTRRTKLTANSNKL